MPSDQKSPTNEEYLFLLARQVLTILGFLVILTLLTALIVVAAYVYAVFNPPQPGQADPAPHLLVLVNNLWDKVVPLGQKILAAIAPVLILLAALAALFKLGETPGSQFELHRIASDLPSALAILIVVAICLLPFAGLAIPDVLNNVALVVVGFYFGRKRTSSTVEGSRAAASPPPAITQPSTSSPT